MTRSGSRWSSRDRYPTEDQTLQPVLKSTRATFTYSVVSTSRLGSWTISGRSISRLLKKVEWTPGSASKPLENNRKLSHIIVASSTMISSTCTEAVETVWTVTKKKRPKSREEACQTISSTWVCLTLEHSDGPSAKRRLIPKKTYFPEMTLLAPSISRIRNSMSLAVTSKVRSPTISGCLTRASWSGLASKRPFSMIREFSLP